VNELRLKAERQRDPVAINTAQPERLTDIPLERGLQIRRRQAGLRRKRPKSK